MTREKISIKWKIFLFLLGFIFILLMILWTFQIVYLGSVYKWIKTREAQSATSSIIELIQSGSNSDDTQSAIDEVAAEYNLAVFLADTKGNELFNAEYIPTSRLNTLPKTEFTKYYEAAKANDGVATISFKGGMDQTFSQENREIPKDPQAPDDPSAPQNDSTFIQNHGQQMAESVILVHIITSSDGEEEVLLVNSVLTPVTATVNTLKAELIVITFVMVVLSMILALLISRHISKSMIRLNQSAKELAKVILMFILMERIIRRSQSCRIL